MRSRQTKKGLAKAKADGAKLGGLRHGARELNRQSHIRAVELAKKYQSLLVSTNGKSLREFSKILYEAGCMTKGGKRLSASQVKRMLDRQVIDLAAVKERDRMKASLVSFLKNAKDKGDISMARDVIIVIQDAFGKAECEAIVRSLVAGL